MIKYCGETGKNEFNYWDKWTEEEDEEKKEERKRRKDHVKLAEARAEVGATSGPQSPSAKLPNDNEQEIGCV